jgi:hypothetical protein
MLRHTRHNRALSKSASATDTPSGLKDTVQVRLPETHFPRREDPRHTRSRIKTLRFTETAKH